MEEYRRILNKQAAAGKLEELYRTLKSDRFINQELTEFYHNFDVSFLKIFPNFVEEFNRLLPVEAQLHPKNEELLVTELRIFALIRLGITAVSYTHLLDELVEAIFFELLHSKSEIFFGHAQ